MRSSSISIHNLYICILSDVSFTVADLWGLVPVTSGLYELEILLEPPGHEIRVAFLKLNKRLPFSCLDFRFETASVGCSWI